MVSIIFSAIPALPDCPRQVRAYKLPGICRLMPGPLYTTVMKNTCLTVIIRVNENSHPYAQMDDCFFTSDYSRKFLNNANVRISADTAETHMRNDTMCALHTLYHISPKKSTQNSNTFYAFDSLGYSLTAGLHMDSRRLYENCDQKAKIPCRSRKNILSLSALLCYNWNGIAKKLHRAERFDKKGKGVYFVWSGKSRI